MSVGGEEDGQGGGGEGKKGNDGWGGGRGVLEQCKELIHSF